MNTVSGCEEFTSAHIRRFNVLFTSGSSDLRMQKLVMSTLLGVSVLTFFHEEECFGSIIHVISVEAKIYSNTENVED
jgi:hypothetical protein